MDNNNIAYNFTTITTTNIYNNNNINNFKYYK